MANIFLFVSKPLWHFILPTAEFESILHLEETQGMAVVLILLIHKPCWGLFLQSLASIASQNTVTSGMLHWEIMLCDPGGNGWWRSQHWDVFCPSFFLCICASFLRCTACQIRSVNAAPLLCVCGLWSHLSLYFTASISHLCFMIPSIIETSRSALFPAFPKPSPGPGTPAPTMGVELCMVGFSEQRIRHRLSHDLHNPCSPEHPMWLPCMQADIPTKNARLAERLQKTICLVKRTDINNKMNVMEADVLTCTTRYTR